MRDESFHVSRPICPSRPPVAKLKRLQLRILTLESNADAVCKIGFWGERIFGADSGGFEGKNRLQHGPDGFAISLGPPNHNP
jgi:hypothetical protein